MAKVSPTQAWLWHRRLSHLNFDHINLVSKKDVVIGLPKLKAYFESEKELIHLILTGIGDGIYSTVDACQTAQEMWCKAIEGLLQQSNSAVADKDEEIDEKSMEAHYIYMAKDQENVIDERVALANLIANLKLDVDENKKIQKQLKKANATLTQELTECKSILAETSRTLVESNSIRDSCLVALQNKQTEFESKSRQAYNVMTNNIINLKEIVDQAWVKHSNDLLYLRNPTAQDMEILVKTCLMPLALKTQNDSFAFVPSTLKQEMHADLKYVESLEDELDELESDKAEFSNMYDMLLQECVSKDVMCSYLQSSSDA
ncbi:retrovirus-related pol polyprotein from transposon TNT 1-94 [Tanacetum coccineum]